MPDDLVQLVHALRQGPFHPVREGLVQVRALVLRKRFVRRVPNQLVPEPEAHLLIEGVQLRCLLVEPDEFLAHERHQPHYRRLALCLRAQLRHL